MNCNRTTDNKHFDCPPRMSDGRHFTDYRPECYVNDLIRADNGVNNNLQWRNFLTQNAEKLMDLNRQHACQKNCCGGCGSPFNVGTMVPEVNKFVCNTGSCRLISGDPNGIGTGRVYSNQNGDCKNLPSTWPQSNKDVCVPPELAGNYYPLDKKTYNTIQRNAIPSGGMIIKDGGDPMAMY